MTDAMQAAMQGAMQGAMLGAHAPMHAHMLSPAAEGALGRVLLSGGGEPGYVAAEDQCLLSNVTYEDRHINTDTMTWCTVPGGAFDAVFFAAFAVIVACLASEKWMTLICLVAGGIYQGLSHAFNLNHVSNASALWLNMNPPDLFVYVFLPPLLLLSSMLMDLFLLRKVIWNVLFLAIFLVVGCALLMIPFMLDGLGLKYDGWRASHAALFGTMIGATDAASVIAVLHGSGAPEILSVILDAESLLNDASALTMFEIFKEVVEKEEDFTAEVVGQIFKEIVVAFFGGAAIGIASGIFTQVALRWMQLRRMVPVAEIALTLGMAYFAFYITQVYMAASGVIAVVAYGFYGSATTLWGMSKSILQRGTLVGAYNIICFVLNGIIFFLVGASSTNLVIMTGRALNSGAEAAPTDNLSEFFQRLCANVAAIYAFSFGLRFFLMWFAFKVFELLHLSDATTLRSVLFMSAAGLRGSLTLVLVQTVIKLDVYDLGNEETFVLSEIALWTTAYVILTLVVNAPLLSPLMSLLRLNAKSAEQLHLQAQVKGLLRKHTGDAVQKLRSKALTDQMLHGVSWPSVERDVGIWDAGAGDHTWWSYFLGFTPTWLPHRWRRPAAVVAGAPPPPPTGATAKACDLGKLSNQESVFQAYMVEASTVGLFEDTRRRGGGGARAADARVAADGKDGRDGKDSASGGIAGGGKHGGVGGGGQHHHVMMGTHPDGTYFLRAPARLLHHQGTIRVDDGSQGAGAGGGAAAAFLWVGPWRPAGGGGKAGERRRQLDHGAGTLRRRPFSPFHGSVRGAEIELGRTSTMKRDVSVMAQPPESYAADVMPGAQAPGDMLSAAGAVGTGNVTLVVDQGDGPPGSDDGSSGGARPPTAEEELSGLRVRTVTLAGQFFRARFLEGLMRARSARTLGYACEELANRLEADEADGRSESSTFALWSLAREEMAPHAALHLLSRWHHALRNSVAAARCGAAAGRCGGGWRARAALAVRLPLLRLLSWLLGHETNMRMEVALQLWMGLAGSGRMAWLEQLGEAGEKLLGEVKREADHAWAYVLERAIEAPEAFTAIQTYLVTMALLTQHGAFIDRMRADGLIEEEEEEQLQLQVTQRRQRVERAGPRMLHAGKLAEFLAGQTLLRDAGQGVLRQLLEASELKVYPPGQQVFSAPERIDGGAETLLVVSGMLRVTVELAGSCAPVAFYVGPGSTVGLDGVVLREYVPGVSLCGAIAEADALGRGPLLLAVPAGFWRFSEDAEEDPGHQELQLQVKRLVASFITQRAKGLLMRTLTASVWGLVSAGVLGEAGATARSAARAGRELPSGAGGAGGSVSLRHRLLLLSESNARRVLSPDAPAPLGLAALKALVAHHVSCAAHSGHARLSGLMSSGMLLVLRPGDPFVQPHSAAVLVRGSLVPGAAPAGSGGANGKHGDSNGNAGGEADGVWGGKGGAGEGPGAGDQSAVGRRHGVRLCVRGLPHTPDASGASGAAHGGGPGGSTAAFAAPSVLVWGPTLFDAAELNAVGVTVGAQVSHASAPQLDDPLVAGPHGAQLIVA